ncbi:MAG: mandelate racemase [Alphaproteobacteria bacterium]|nr:mandelate racemase [Alphaproteobacteria bacterium]
MKIKRILERTVPISRYADPSIPSGGLDTSIVAVVTDRIVDGAPIVGYGFASIGRFGQGGLIRERFAPRLLAAPDCLGDPPDPFRAWRVMMTGEKPGGHGERSVAVGTLDMAIWDACAKAAGLPLYRCIQRHLDRESEIESVPVYAGGGYYFPEDDGARLRDEMQMFAANGFTHAKIKIGGKAIAEDVRRIETAMDVLGGGDCLAVDAIYSYDHDEALAAADEIEQFGLWWFEDICDPLDFETIAAVIERYRSAVAVGEAQFSIPDARNLIRYSRLRPDRDILLFDIAHSYGLPEYLGILRMAEALGWDRKSFFPHGGHLFTLHAVAALGLGGAEINPHNFQPFGGLTDDARVVDGHALPPELPGIGFEGRTALADLFHDLLKEAGR